MGHPGKATSGLELVREFWGLLLWENPFLRVLASRTPAESFSAGSMSPVFQSDGGSAWHMHTYALLHTIPTQVTHCPHIHTHTYSHACMYTFTHPCTPSSYTRAYTHITLALHLLLHSPSSHLHTCTFTHSLKHTAAHLAQTCILTHHTLLLLISSCCKVGLFWPLREWPSSRD